MNHDNRDTLQKRAEKVIGQGALTNSKRPQSFVRGVYPTHITKADGCYVWDEHGKRYTDFICALGTNLLGYRHREIESAILSQLGKGTLFSLGSNVEVEFAEKLQATFPYMEKFKFLKDGSSGCSAAVRMARTKTDREIVYSDAYHGWHDDFVHLTAPAKGVPDNYGHPREWIKPLTHLNTDEHYAAIIIEPVITDTSEKQLRHLRYLREKTEKAGAVLIFDETITALRFPGLSVAKWSGVLPDLTVFGKALGGGMPLSVVGGKKEILDSDYFVSGTYFGETLSMVAASKTLDFIKQSGFLEAMSFEAECFQNEFNAMTPQIQIKGYPLRGVFEAEPLTKALFFQEACKAGMLFGSSFFWCEPHRHERKHVIAVCKTILKRIELGEVRLEGDLPVTPFAQKVRNA